MNRKPVRLATILAAFSLAIGIGEARADPGIQPNQAVRIQVANVPDSDRATINGEYPVSAEGLVNMPMIGRLRAAGLSSDAFARTLEKAYIDAGIFTNPAFQVFANRIENEPVLQVVHIGGHVRRPGPVPFANGLTAWQAVQAAGGATEFGEMRDVLLFREGRVIRLNLARNDAKQFVLRPSDTIEVPQKRILRIPR